MSSKIKFVYFDGGNVLHRFEGGFQAISKKHNLPLEVVAAFGQKYDGEICLGNLSRQQWYEKLTQELNLEFDPNFDFTKFWFDCFSPVQESFSLVEELITHGFKVGILTNNAFKTWERLNERGLVPKVNYTAVICSSAPDIKSIKPGEKIYQIAQERSGVKPEEILFIDDHQENLDTAHKLGWETVLFDKSNPAASVLKVRQILDLK